MPRLGFIASPLNIPPLVFQFQYNPEILSNKKSFNYRQAESYGEWGFEKTVSGVAGAAGFWKGPAAVKGVVDDLKDFGSLMTKTKPLEAQEGEPQTIGVEFKLDASPSAQDLADAMGDPLMKRTEIDTDLAVLRAFMYPWWELLDLVDVFQGKHLCPTRPPEVSFVHGGLSVTGHITDLNIKITGFTDKGKPMKADIDLTIKEQTRSFGPIGDLIKRLVLIDKALFTGKVPLGEALNAVYNPFAE